MYDFFIAIREANGAIGRSLLEEWVGSQPKEVQKDFLTVNPDQRNLFFKRWKRIYKVVYRRITGTKQYFHSHFHWHMSFLLGPPSNPYVACGLHLSICTAINANRCFALSYVARPLGPHVGSAVGVRI